MKSIFLILLSINILAATDIQPKTLLDSITKYAVRIGTGEVNSYYIFVDPMCPHSKKLIALLSKDMMKQIQSTYYVFLYRLPKFESDKLINYVYQSHNPKSSLLDIMVENKKPDLTSYKPNTAEIKIVENIASIAKELKMKKRPYIMHFENTSIFCTVSEGSAPCLEKFDF
ncbi:MAG: hypothetical protein H8E76_03275 [Helicobacteraceae bacterium]|nr:hypothetical protein [Candidatus Sulfurimonas ponti]MBL6973066.1 hypothetical protein [Sulfurimonas sp.]